MSHCRFDIEESRRGCIYRNQACEEVVQTRSHQCYSGAGDLRRVPDALLPPFHSIGNSLRLCDSTATVTVCTIANSVSRSSPPGLESHVPLIDGDGNGVSNVGVPDLASNSSVRCFSRNAFGERPWASVLTAASGPQVTLLNPSDDCFLTSGQWPWICVMTAASGPQVTWLNPLIDVDCFR